MLLLLLGHIVYKWQKKKIIHLELLSDKSHHYFGSLKAIYELFQSNEIGITYGTLKNLKLSKDNPYRNVRCIIRVTSLITIESSRGKYERQPKVELTKNSIVNHEDDRQRIR